MYDFYRFTITLAHSFKTTFRADLLHILYGDILTKVYVSSCTNLLPLCVTRTSFLVLGSAPSILYSLSSFLLGFLATLGHALMIRLSSQGDSVVTNLSENNFAEDFFGLLINTITCCTGHSAFQLIQLYIFAFLC